MEFKSLSDFAKYLEKITKSYPSQLNYCLHSVGHHLKEKAKHSIGHLQQGASEFSAWEELSDSTRKDKERKGYVFNSDYNPLLRTGELRDSIQSQVVANQLYLGSDDQIMVYQELGTEKIPPRSVLGMTMFKESKYIQKSLATMLLAWILNKNKIPL